MIIEAAHVHRADVMFFSVSLSSLEVQGPLRAMFHSPQDCMYRNCCKVCALQPLT